MASGFMDEPAQIEPIKVCLRLRPINSLEESRRSHNCVTTTAVINPNNPNNHHHVVGDTNNTNNNNSSSVVLSVASPLQGPFSFAYDAVFDVDSSQANVYDHAAAPLATSVLEGFNCALIAYGQTGSGKTYTMMGNSSSGGGDSGGKTGKTNMATDNHRGMIPRLIHDVFRQMTLSSPTVEYIVKCSFVEIYLEKVMDLLSPVNRSIRIVEADCSSARGMLCETTSNNNDGGEQGT
eukprot:scaffold110895_cov20-Cyclotella_meneghiniana.AAC.1